MRKRSASHRSEGDPAPRARARSLRGARVGALGLSVEPDTWLGGGIAIAAAFLLALAAALQQRVAFEVPTDEALHLSFVGRLLRRPLWLLGMALDIAALVAQGRSASIRRAAGGSNRC